MSRLFPVLAVATVCLVLGGCLGEERLVETSLITADPRGAVDLFDDRGRPIDLPARVEKGTRKKSLDVLALSGGGADGAYGAGFLVGWSEAGTRPRFDVVTGVSTGALQATFAFLGSKYDPVLTDLYTNTSSHDIFTHRGVSGLLGDALMDTEALAVKIAEVVTPEILAEVAEEHRRGRRLYVATTNLDAGVVAVWDMGKIAGESSADGGRLYREVLRASAAVPGYFEPVIIHPTAGVDTVGQMHVDGGVKVPVLVRSFMLEGKYEKKNLWVLVNGAMRLTSGRAAVHGSLGGIAKRSIAELLRSLLYKTVYQSYVIARRSGGAFHIAHVPDDVRETHDPLEFDPAEMSMLYDVGHSHGRSAASWADEPPRLEAAERIAVTR